MLARVLVLALLLAAAGCERTGDSRQGPADDPSRLEAPAPDTEPARRYAPANDAATATTGPITFSLATRLDDASGGQETLTITGANGLSIEASVTSAVSPATQVQGQTLRALMELPVEEPQTLVYRVSSQAAPRGGQGVCGGADPAFIVVWEPAGPSDSLKFMGLTGGAPGAAGAHACPMLEYRRG